MEKMFFGTICLVFIISTKDSNIDISCLDGIGDEELKVLIPDNLRDRIKFKIGFKNYKQDVAVVDANTDSCDTLSDSGGSIDSLESIVFNDNSQKGQCKKETYYVPCRTIGSKVTIPAKGKLVDRYYNQLRRLRGSGVLPKKRKVNCENTSENETSTDNDTDEPMKEKHTWLKFNRDPWPVVEEKWRETCAYRKKNCYQSDIPLSDVINDWPCLKHSIGYQLIEIDFAYLYPDACLQLFAKWNSFQTRASDSIAAEIEHELNQYLKEGTDKCHACFTQNETHDLGPLKSGTPFYRECYCDDSTTPMYTAEHLKWLDIYDHEIGQMGPGTQPKIYTEQSRYSVSLHIPSLSTTMSGKYKCVMEHGDGKIFSYTYEVDVYDPLYFYNTEEVQYLITGRDSLITCEARGKTTPLISWNKGNDMVNWNTELGELTEIADDEKYEIVKQGVMVKNVTYDDGGIYKCTATVFETGEDVDRYIKVEVMTAPLIEEIVATPANTVIVGSALSIECKAEGFPLPKYSWYKIPKPKDSDGPVRDVVEEGAVTLILQAAEQNNTWSQEMNIITYESVLPEDRGIYQCIAENQAGVAKKNIIIDVFTPPTITQFKNVTAAEGSTEQIICRASGRPTPAVNIAFETESSEDESVTWSLRNISDIETELNLTFNKVRRSHAGFYFCNASNEVDVTFDAMYFSVLYKPYFNETNEIVYAWEENPINLTCDHDSRPPAKVEWRFEGSRNNILMAYQQEVNRILMTKLAAVSNPESDRNLFMKVTNRAQYGKYECSVKNDLGIATKVFDVKEGVTPKSINNITEIDIKATSATFLIEIQQDAGPPVIGFIAEYDEAENYNVTHIHLNRTWAISKEYKLDKLKPMSTYFIKFAAINKVGTGSFSEMFEFDTPEKSIPEPPTLDYESNSTQTPLNRNMVLKLKAPEDNGDPIDYYAIKYCPVPSIGEELEEKTCKEYNVTPTTELLLNDLDYNTTYYLKLVAHNSEGNSAPTDIYFLMPNTDTPPSEEPTLSGGAIIGISVVMVILGILLLDVLLFLTKRQGMIANCCCNKSKKKKETSVQARDKKGLLKDNGESVANDTLKRPDNGHKEFEYNKTTGIITGKHSAV